MEGSEEQWEKDMTVDNCENIAVAVALQSNLPSTITSSSSAPAHRVFSSSTSTTQSGLQTRNADVLSSVLCLVLHDGIPFTSCPSPAASCWSVYRCQTCYFCHPHPPQPGPSDHSPTRAPCPSRTTQSCGTRLTAVTVHTASCATRCPQAQTPAQSISETQIAQFLSPLN